MANPWGSNQKKIVNTHIGSNWQCALEHLYSRAVTINKINVMSAVKDQMFLDEVYILLNTVFYHVHGQDMIDDIEKLITSRAGMMPFEPRFHIWAKLIKTRGSDGMGRISYLFLLGSTRGYIGCF